MKHALYEKAVLQLANSKQKQINQNEMQETQAMKKV